MKKLAILLLLIIAGCTVSIIAIKKNQDKIIINEEQEQSIDSISANLTPLK